MSTRNLEFFFRPKSIAVIGASTREHAIGQLVAANVQAAGFAGTLMAVNPHGGSFGFPVFTDIASLPVVPELAVICTPAPGVAALVADLAERGTKAVVIISAGFEGEAGRPRRTEMLQAAGKHLTRIVGPNCLGLLSTEHNVNVSFAHIPPLKGRVALVTQSGAILTTVLDWASARGIGFSHLVSLGDMADVDFGDMLDYLASDAATDAIVLYVEAITHARKFMSAARAAARMKPVIVIKSGRHPAGAKAALSHTGALAGADAVYDAAFRRAGVLRVRTLDEIFDAIETLGMGYRPSGEKLAILTNGGGAGVLATDALLDLDGTLAELAPETIAKLDAMLPAGWSRGNPVDIIGDAPPARYRDALNILFDAREVNSVLVMNCPTAVASSSDAARAVVEVCSARKRTVLTNWLGTGAAAEARVLFAASHIPTFETPDEAVRGFMHLVRYRRAQDALMEAPPSLAQGVAPDRVRARAIMDAALKTGAPWLPPQDVAELLACYAIPAPRAMMVRTQAEGEAAAARLGGHLALKIVSQDIVHKSDVGGVVLGLGAPSVGAAIRAMQDRVGKISPAPHVDGFLLQEMIERAGALELIVGMTVDPTFGPVLLFGRGGTAVEAIADTTLALPPLNLNLAQAMIAATRVARQLKGYRNHKPADQAAIAVTLVKLSQMVCDLDEIAELDINPLLADEFGAIAVDTRIRLAPSVLPPGRRLAISPYPVELESRQSIADLGELLLRPIRPEDAGAVERYFDRLSPEDVLLRFFTQWHNIPHRQLARLTQIDYDREMAFVLLDRSGEILGIVRLSADPNLERAEYAVSVRSDLKGHGLGEMLMRRLLNYARDRGIAQVYGDILPENRPMIALCRKLGFAIGKVKDAPELTRATITIGAA